MNAPAKTMLMSVVLLLTATVVLGLTGCGQSSSDTAGTQVTGAETTATTSPGTDSTFTPAELARFDGKDGRPAYVAVDGVVYDVSGSRLWPEGEHTTCNLGAMAGKDLSAEIEKAPARMRAALAKMPMVGKLAP